MELYPELQVHLDWERCLHEHGYTRCIPSGMLHALPLPSVNVFNLFLLAFEIVKCDTAKVCAFVVLSGVWMCIICAHYHPSFF